MGDKTGILIAVAIIVPLAVLLIYFAFRNFFASLRNVRDAIGAETARRRQLDVQGIRDSEAVISSVPVHTEGAGLSPHARVESAGTAPPKPSRSYGTPPRPVVLARKPRERGRDWSRDRSWFGGLPKLGGAPWPRGSNGKPLPFAAQIDLAEVAAACPESPLPHTGSLAFFLNEGSVVYVAEDIPEATEPPNDLPPAYDEGGYPLPEQATHTSRPLFPFWPVEPIGLAVPEDLRAYADEERHEEIWEAQNASLKERVAGRQYAFSVYSARQAGIEGADSLWWYGALHVQEQLREAVAGVDRAVALRQEWIEQARGYQARLAAAEHPNEDAIAKSRTDQERHEAQIPDVRRQGAELEGFIARFEDFTAGRSPWTEMTGDEIAVLQEKMAEARKQFPDLCTYRVPAGIDDVRNLCIRRMITGDEEALAALPEPMLAFLNENYRLTTMGPHQMFGLADVRQTNLYDHLEDLLLLQLGYDDMNEWCFGDMGLWQFWISPADVAAGRWDGAKLTFECS
jgi:hypothetical protein